MTLNELRRRVAALPAPLHAGSADPVHVSVPVQAVLERMLEPGDPLPWDTEGFQAPPRPPATRAIKCPPREARSHRHHQIVPVYDLLVGQAAQGFRDLIGAPAGDGPGIG